MMRIPVVRIYNGERIPMPLPACTDIVVNICSPYRRISLAYTIDVSEDNVILAKVEGDQLYVGRYALEVKGKIGGVDWRSNEYEQIAIVDNNASADTSFNVTEEGEDSLLMDTAVAILAPDTGLYDKVLTAEEAREAAESAREDAESERIAKEQERIANEQERKASEASRAENESVRLANEQSRVASESERVKAENIRKANESDRVRNESSRSEAEIAREEAEAIRQQKEASRTEAETHRAAAETKRAEAENVRTQKETERQEAEAKREANEEARKAFFAKVTEQINGKQDKLTFDTEPVEGSSNPVTSDGIFKALSKIDISIFLPVATLPTEDINPNKVYLVRDAEGENGNMYAEYIYTDGAWELIGRSKINLEEYYTKSEIDALFANIKVEGVLTEKDIATVNGQKLTNGGNILLSAETIVLDEEPTEGSVNGVTSGGVVDYGLKNNTSESYDAYITPHLTTKYAVIKGTWTLTEDMTTYLFKARKGETVSVVGKPAQTMFIGFCLEDLSNLTEEDITTITLSGRVVGGAYNNTNTSITTGVTSYTLPLDAWVFCTKFDSVKKMPVITKSKALDTVNANDVSKIIANADGYEGVTIEADNIIGNGKYGVFGNFAYDANVKSYLIPLKEGDILTVYTSRANSWRYTTEDMTGKSMTDIANNPPSWIGMGNDVNSNSEDYVFRFTAPSDVWAFVCPRIDAPAPTIFRKNKLEYINDIKSIFVGEELFKFEKNASITLPSDTRVWKGYYIHVNLDTADSVSIKVIYNQAGTGDTFVFDKDGWYNFGSHLKVGGGGISKIVVNFTGVIGEKTLVCLYAPDSCRLPEFAGTYDSLVELKHNVTRQIVLTEPQILDISQYPRDTTFKIVCESLGTLTDYTISGYDGWSGGSKYYLCQNSTETGVVYKFTRATEQTRLRVDGNAVNGIFDGIKFVIDIESVPKQAERHDAEIKVLRDDYLSNIEVELQDGFDFYKLPKRIYDSYHTLTDTGATLKRITKSAYKYSHCSMMQIYDGWVYLTHMQNSTAGAGENSSSTTYELVLEYFTLERYESDDFDCETDVTTLILGKIGDVYTDAVTGEVMTAEQAPGDTSLQIVDGNLRIVHTIRATGGVPRIITYVFDVVNKAIMPESVRACKLVHNSVEYDFTLDNYKKILEDEGVCSRYIGSMHISSPFALYNNVYYNTLINAASGDNGTNGLLLSTTDFINYNVVSKIPNNTFGADEAMVIASNEYIICACRQGYGRSHHVINIYNAKTSTWLSPTTLPAGNSRPFLWKHNNVLYMMYVVSEQNREVWQIVKQRAHYSAYRFPWEYVATIEANWDYPYIYSYNNVMYFAVSTDTRTITKFGKLKIRSGNAANLIKKLITLLDS